MKLHKQFVIWFGSQLPTRKEKTSLNDTQKPLFFILNMACNGIRIPPIKILPHKNGALFLVPVQKFLTFLCPKTFYVFPQS